MFFFQGALICLVKTSLKSVIQSWFHTYFAVIANLEGLYSRRKTSLPIAKGESLEI